MGMFQAVGGIHIRITVMIITNTLILGLRESFGSFLQALEEVPLALKLSLINEMPANANQVSTILNLNYKTVIHHLNVLIKNGLIITEDKEIYGSTYFLTPLMEQNFQLFKEIVDKIKKPNI